MICCESISKLLLAACPGAVLLTTLTQAAVIRAAQMLDLCAIVFVNGAIPETDTLELAKQIGLPVLMTEYSAQDCQRLLAGRGFAPITEDGCAAAGVS